MRKDELLYLHQLLATVKRDLEERGGVSPADVDAYESVTVSPVAAYAQKGDHEAAVMALARDLTTAVGPEADEDGSDEQPQPVSP
ncbi:UPF0058 family protein [Halorientalis marina]|jgi:hypothetical protein|uniref:UPF0058 family protein n=1 Tax=Halorientalis marina TaxID=2931976 RepID=UPI001FF2C3AE|nr:UPF0058 family protein [Halorientalis marina]